MSWVFLVRSIHWMSQNLQKHGLTVAGMRRAGERWNSQRPWLGRLNWARKETLPKREGLIFHGSCPTWPRSETFETFFWLEFRIKQTKLLKVDPNLTILTQTNLYISTCRTGTLWKNKQMPFQFYNAHKALMELEDFQRKFYPVFDDRWAHMKHKEAVQLVLKYHIRTREVVVEYLFVIISKHSLRTTQVPVFLERGLPTSQPSLEKYAQLIKSDGANLKKNVNVIKIEQLTAKGGALDKDVWENCCWGKGASLWRQKAVRITLEQICNLFRKTITTRSESRVNLKSTSRPFPKRCLTRCTTCHLFRGWRFCHWDKRCQTDPANAKFSAGLVRSELLPRLDFFAIRKIAWSRSKWTLNRASLTQSRSGRKWSNRKRALLSSMIENCSFVTFFKPLKRLAPSTEWFSWTTIPTSHTGGSITTDTIDARPSKVFHWTKEQAHRVEFTLMGVTNKSFVHEWKWERQRLLEIEHPNQIGIEPPHLLILFRCRLFSREFAH